MGERWLAMGAISSRHRLSRQGYVLPRVREGYVIDVRICAYKHSAGEGFKAPPLNSVGVKL